MPAYTFYHPTLSSTQIALEREEFKHLKTVMRQKQGDVISVMDGKGSLAKARIDSMDTSSAKLTILSKETILEPTIRFSLAIAHIRPARFDDCLEKVCPMGPSDIYTFPAAWSENQKGFSLHQKARHEAIAINSCKQSGQLFFPKIHYLNAMDQLPSSTKQIFCDPLAKTPLYEELKSTLFTSSFQILIGPESGFTDTEMLHYPKATSVRLASVIYRSELAAIVSCGIIKHFLDSLSK